MKKAIVTGANGFVGTALCRELVSEGFEVTALVKNSASDVAAIREIPEIRIVYAGLEEYDKLPDKISDRDIDVCFHLAWNGTSGPLRGDVSVQLANIQATGTLITSCAVMKCKRFVYAGSIMEYEIEAIMNGDGHPGIRSIYAIAKLAADYMAKVLAESNRMEYIRAIMSNVYGPGEKSERLLNASLRKMLRKERCLFTNGEQKYDFIYITDAAKAFVEIADKGFAGKTYYIGNMQQRQLKDYLMEMRDAVDPDSYLGLGEIPFNGVSLKYDEFDTEAVFRDTGFLPQVPFGEGIKRTLEWLCEDHMDL